MKEASTTALMVTGFRALATEEKNPLIQDPYAKALVGEDLERVTSGFLQAFPPMTLWIATRTAYLDACVKRYTAPPHKLSQVVILGAGFDTRAARLRCDGVTFYEVDTPASQAEKHKRLQTLSGYPVDAATYVSCNFEHENFVEKLLEAGLSLEQPTLVLWEGVSYYLTETAVQLTLERIASLHPNSVLAFDYVGKAFVQRQIPKDQQDSLDVVAGMGEPMIWGCNDILPVLYNAGFKMVQTTRFDEACLAFTGTYDRTRMFRFQSLAIASPSQHRRPLPHIGG